MTFKIILHHPSANEGRLELEQRAAKAHAQAAATYIQDLACPVEQKSALLNSIKRCQKD
ncbi:MAG: hypothetical protein GX025_05700 [Clostridiales bacterium]|nr:hypothetical protein [Clostridiales bacterium]